MKTDLETNKTDVERITGNGSLEMSVVDRLRKMSGQTIKFKNKEYLINKVKPLSSGKISIQTKKETLVLYHGEIEALLAENHDVEMAVNDGTIEEVSKKIFLDHNSTTVLISEKEEILSKIISETGGCLFHLRSNGKEWSFYIIRSKIIFTGTLYEVLQLAIEEFLNNREYVGQQRHSNNWKNFRYGQL